MWHHRRRGVLAGVFVAILVGALYASAEWAHVVATLIVVAIALCGLAVAFLNWERVVSRAQSAGLVARTDR